MIVAGEEAFARRVALGVIVTTSLSAWHFFIPFMFVFDFLKRTKASRQYTQQYMFLRNMALDVAEEIRIGKDVENSFSKMENSINQHQRGLNLSSENLLRCRMKTAHLLVDHYLKMLDADGNDYITIVRNAYPERKDYAQFLTHLSTAEKEADLLLMKTIGAPGKRLQKMSAEHRQLEIQREKDLVILY